MEKVTEDLISAIMIGGPNAIIALLVVIIVGLLFERNRTNKLLDAKEAKIDKIMEEYHKGNMSIIDAMNGLRSVLDEIKGRI